MAQSVVTGAALTRAQGMVTREAIAEVDYLVRDAMIGQAMLSHYGTIVAGGDPFIEDEVRHMVTVARLAKAQLIFDAVERFGRGR